MITLGRVTLEGHGVRLEPLSDTLGAKLDGVLRHHWKRRDGSVRDSVMFSILRHEWPDVSRHLELRLLRHRAG